MKKLLNACPSSTHIQSWHDVKDLHVWQYYLRSSQYVSTISPSTQGVHHFAATPGHAPPDGPRSFDQVLTCKTISQAGQLATCKLGAAIGEASKINWRKLAKAGKPTMQCNRLGSLQWLWNETNGSGSNPLGSAVANDSKTCSIHKCSHNLMHVHCCELPPRLLQSPLNGKYLCFLSRLKAPIRLLMRKHHLVKGTICLSSDHEATTDSIYVYTWSW